jgi:nucleotide-binding universal stress UspA family protein
MDPQNLEAGQVIDGFVLEEALPPGGMASFWRVSRPGSTLPMVMKIPLMRRGEDPLTIVGFEAEQMILARLTGPHVPKFIAAGDFERPYIVMEYVAGRSVRSFLDATPLPPEEVAAIGAKIAFALHDLHRQHVVHLDLKPSNVILRGDGEAVLIDFGLSRHAQLPDLVAEEFDDPVGTGPYIAPEQVLRQRDDPRSDIFALGVILYFLATGERPFGEPQRAGEWRRRLWRDPHPPRRLNDKVPPWLQEIILRCLAVDPAERYATAAQLAFDLQHPDQVPLTERASRGERDGRITVALRWLRARRLVAPVRRSVAGLLSRAPIIMVAVDLAPDAADLRDALIVAVRRVLATEPQARLACVNVLRTSRIAIDAEVDEQGRNLHLRHLVELKHWARTLPTAARQITYHVIESVDVASALIEYARHNRIDHVVIGARGASTLRRLLGSVSAKVVAEAPCTVTVVRTRAEAGEAPG